jgi:hypothetical protein
VYCIVLCSSVLYVHLEAVPLSIIQGGRDSDWLSWQGECLYRDTQTRRHGLDAGRWEAKMNERHVTKTCKVRN